MNWVEMLLWVAVVLASVPLLVLAAECFAALLPMSRTASVSSATRPRCAVLIPAHNEEAGLPRTLAAVTPQLRPHDRVLVVADNCTDRTAEVARESGAEAAERFNATERGKGYALAFGVDQLRSDPPDVVVILDADCVIGDGALDLLAATAHATGRPAQGAYRMDAPAGAGPDRQVASFAFVVKNVVRPRGLLRLGQPCLLTGTGMAFPWDVIASAKLGHGHIVEDMQLAVDLVLAGRPPVFVPEAGVRSEFPAAEAAAASQRRRWEHGHLQVLTSTAPRLLAAGLARGRLGLIALALELSVPPLTLLILGCVTLSVALAAFGLWTGQWAPALSFAGVGGAATVSLLLVWRKFGRAELPVKTVLRTPVYALKKIPLYAGFLHRRQSEWVRTARV